MSDNAEKDKVKLDGLKKHIDQIVQGTFERLKEAYEHQEGITDNVLFHKNKTSLVFPKYGQHRNYEIRVSEQELRFAFVETFNRYCDSENLDLFYSVETPTNARYVFKDGHADAIKLSEKEGVSASFDMVIHDSSLKRVALIEFKALNAAKHDHKKDYAKLTNLDEGDSNHVLRYFIEVLKVSKDKTYTNLKNKLEEIKDSDKVTFVCFDLENMKDITKQIIK